MARAVEGHGDTWCPEVDEEPAHALPAAPATHHGVEILKAPGGLPPFRKPLVLRSPKKEGDGGTCATCRLTGCRKRCVRSVQNVRGSSRFLM